MSSRDDLHFVTPLGEPRALIITPPPGRDPRAGLLRALAAVAAILTIADTALLVLALRPAPRLGTVSTLTTLEPKRREPQAQPHPPRPAPPAPPPTVAPPKLSKLTPSPASDRHRRTATATVTAPPLPPPPPPPPPAVDLPASITRAAIATAMAKVEPRVRRCHDGESRGQVLLRFSVAPAGTVTKITVLSAPTPALGTCAADAARAATFPATQEGGSFAQPFRF